MLSVHRCLAGRPSQRIKSIVPPIFYSSVLLFLSSCGGGGAGVSIQTDSNGTSQDQISLISEVTDVQFNEDTQGEVDVRLLNTSVLPSTPITFSLQSEPAELLKDYAITGEGTSKILRITPAEDKYGQAVMTLRAQQDNNITVRQFTMNVQAVDDAPRLTIMGDLTVQEHSNVPLYPLTVEDPDSSAKSVVIEARSSNPLLLPDSQILVKGSDSQRWLQLTPLANQVGDTTITVTATDGSGLATTAQFLFRVVEVNDAPVISPITDQVLQEDASSSVAFTVLDDVNAGALLSVSVTSDNEALFTPDSLVVETQDDQRRLQLTPQPNMSGDATFTVKASDGSLSSQRVFRVSVTAVDDAPIVAVINDQTMEEDGSPLTVSFSVEDIDTPIDMLSITASSSNPELLPVGAFSFESRADEPVRMQVKPAANAHGIAIVDVLVKDAVTQVKQSFVMRVSSVNDLPVISGTPVRIDAQQHRPVVHQLAVSDADGDALQFSLVGGASLGTVSFSSQALGEFQYLATKLGQDNFQIRISDGTGQVDVPVVVDVAGDPLFAHQWHLLNNGQTAYSISSGVANEDINLAPLYQQGDELPTGQGVTVAILDSGLELAHPDLKTNIVENGSYNFVSGTNDPTNTGTSDGDHGTSVAGIVAAAGWNGVGGRGVAPQASLKGFNIVRAGAQVADEIKALGGADFSADVDIFNSSYGLYTGNDITADPLIIAQLKDGVSRLRDGKGAIYIKSAGNGFEKFTGGNCDKAKERGVSCHNTNMSPYRSVPYNLVVASVNAHGVRATTSSTGSSVFIAAPGGEDGFTAPALITADQQGCDKGYSRTGIGHGFNGGSLSTNALCDYVSTFSGTSAAAPVVSGVVALMLEVNPQLSWRDVRYILAKTAIKVDQNQPGNADDGFTLVQGWITNAAGFNFHNWYGFGRVDATAAVALARSYDSNLGAFTDTGWLSRSQVNKGIPDYQASGVEDVLNQTQNMLVDSVQVEVDIDHDYTSDLAIELISPSGTRSLLLNHFNGFGDTDDLKKFVLLSNAFYREQASGVWRLRVIDAGRQDAGVLRGWKLKVYGNAVN